MAYNFNDCAKLVGHFTLPSVVSFAVCSFFVLTACLWELLLIFSRFTIFIRNHNHTNNQLNELDQ